MKRTKMLVALLLLVSLVMACFAGCGKAPTFGEWTDNEVFQNIPAMVVEVRRRTTWRSNRNASWSSMSNIICSNRLI